MKRESHLAQGTIPVIVNTSSGPGHAGDNLDRLRELFRDAGLEPDIVPIGRDDDIRDLARKALASNPPILVAAGGDGTMSTVADVVRGTDTALGVLPFGTFNHFPRDLGIPENPKDAIRAIVEGHRVAVDVGEVNGVGFINNSSLGLYPGIVRERERLQRRFSKRRRSAMAWAMLATLKREPLLHLRLRFDDREADLRVPFVFIGNNEYVMEGFEIGRRERLDGGFLSIYTTARSTARGLCALAMRAICGRLRQAKDFAAMRARSLQVDTPRGELLVATDGEVTRMKTPLEYLIVPRSLHVIVSRPAS